MKIDMHMHTKASFDCESDPAEILCWAARKQINALVVTDHDSTDGFAELKAEADKAGITVIPGVEHTSSKGTHYLIYLTPELPLPTDDMEMIREVHSRGGLVGIAHPYRSDTGIIYNQNEKSLYTEDEVSEILEAADFIEVFNGKSKSSQNAQAQDLASHYPNLKQIAGSDSHHPSTIGSTHTEITGFNTDSISEMAESFKTLDFKIVTLAELNESKTEARIKNTVEGVRKLMVKMKPLIPTKVWETGKTIYRKNSNKIANKKATKSLVEK